MLDSDDDMEDTTETERSRSMTAGEQRTEDVTMDNSMVEDSRWMSDTSSASRSAAAMSEIYEGVVLEKRAG